MPHARLPEPGDQALVLVLALLWRARRSGPGGLPMTDREPLMNIRTFLRGGYRDLEAPTTIISGTTRLGVWLPETFLPDAAPGPAHPEPEGAPAAIADREGRTGHVEAQEGATAPADERTEAPHLGGTVSPAGGSGARRASLKAPARRSVQQTLDEANKAGRS